LCIAALFASSFIYKIQISHTKIAFKTFLRLFIYRNENKEEEDKEEEDEEEGYLSSSLFFRDGRRDDVFRPRRQTTTPPKNTHTQREREREGDENNDAILFSLFSFLFTPNPLNPIFEETFSL